MQQREHLRVVPHRLDQRVNCRRILRIASGRQFGEGEVVTHEPQHDPCVRGRQTPSLENPRRDCDSGFGMVDGRFGFADVMQERGDEQQVRARDVAHEFACARDGFDRVAVDRMPVHGTVLRPAPHHGPLGQPGVDDTREIQPLPQRHKLGTRREDSAQKIARSVVPCVKSVGLQPFC